MTKTTVRAWFLSGLLMGSTISCVLLSAIFSERSEAITSYVNPIEIHFDLNPIVEPQYDYDEVECLAKNIYFEARGESTEGQIAVAQVAMNRAKSDMFPNNICDVIYQGPVSNWFLVEKNKIVPLLHECQFSWWCDGKSDVPRDMWAWGRAMTIASAVLKGEVEDNTQGAMWYHATSVNPNWNRLAEIATIDNHIFYVAENL